MSDAFRSEFRIRLRRQLNIVLPVILLLFWLFAPWAARSRSLLIMTAYDKYCERDSVPRQTGISVQLPMEAAAQADETYRLYPIQMTFNDHEGMSAHLDSEVRFTVDYSFADFARIKPPLPLTQDHSAIYETSSPLYGAYVGVYYISAYGKALDRDTALAVAAYDQQQLALPALGLASGSFEVSDVTCSQSQLTATDSLPWERCDATILTNGPEHEVEHFLFSYLQFGRPDQAKEDYPQRSMRAALLSAYLPEEDLNLGLYVIAHDQAAVDLLCDQVLAKAELLIRSTP